MSEPVCSKRDRESCGKASADRANEVTKNSVRKNQQKLRLKDRCEYNMTVKSVSFCAYLPWVWANGPKEEIGV